MAVVMDAAAIEGFLEEHFPQALKAGFEIVEVTTEGVTIRLPTTDRHLRPGGTVSGPTLMMLADTAVYFSILARVGSERLTVTTNLEMHFLRRAPPGEIVATGRLVKLGRTLAVGTVTMTSPDTDEPVAIATVTYALAGRLVPPA